MEGHSTWVAYVILCIKLYFLENYTIIIYIMTRCVKQYNDLEILQMYHNQFSGFQYQ